MTSHCKYHPGEEATWYCHHDGISFCDDCIAVDEQGEIGRCFICNKPAKQMGRRIARDPFWRILSHFIEYPLSLAPMVVAVVASLGLGVLPASFEGALIAAGLGVLVAGMGAAMMAQTINGVMRPPGFDALQDKDVWVSGFQQWLVFGGAMVGIGMAYVKLGMIMGSLVALGVWLVIPAMLVEIHVGGSLINLLIGPQRLVAHMLTLGGDYFYAGAVLFGLFTGGAIMVSIVHDLLPNLIGWPLAGIIIAWFWFITEHLLGYLCCQNREALGYNRLISANEERRRRARRPEDERRVAVLLREGRFEKVISLYKARLEKKKDDMATNEQYERMLEALGRSEEQLEHADQYLAVMLKYKHEYRVVDLIRRYLEIDAGFRPGTAQLSWDVAQVLADNSQFKLAVSMLQDLHKRAPTWPHLPNAYLFIAKLLKNEFKLDGKAEQYIRFVEQRFHEPKIKKLADDCRAELGMARA